MKSIVPVLLAMTLGATGCNSSAETAMELTITTGHNQAISAKTLDFPATVSENIPYDAEAAASSEDVLSETTEIPEEALPLAEIPAADINKTYGERVAELVNAERRAVGLAPLALDASLTAAAQTRSQEVKTTFGHTRPNGSSCFTVLDENNIPYCSAAENIAGKIQSPEKVVQAWMRSEGHRKHILDAEYTSIGVGYTEGGYWSQLFTD